MLSRLKLKLIEVLAMTFSTHHHHHHSYRRIWQWLHTRYPAPVVVVFVAAAVLVIRNRQMLSRLVRDDQGSSRAANDSTGNWVLCPGSAPGQIHQFLMVAWYCSKMPNVRWTMSYKFCKKNHTLSRLYSGELSRYSQRVRKWARRQPIFNHSCKTCFMFLLQ